MFLAILAPRPGTRPSSLPLSPWVRYKCGYGMHACIGVSRLRGAMVEEQPNPSEHDEAGLRESYDDPAAEYVPGSRRADAMGRRPPVERVRLKRLPLKSPLWTRVTMAAAIGLVFLLLGLWPWVQGRLQATEKLRQAEAMLAPAKQTVLRIDNTVNTQLSAEAEPSVPSVAAEILVARRELSTTIKLIDEAMPHLTKDEKTRAEALRTAASARLAMIKVAPGILITSTKAVQAKQLGDKAWRIAKEAARREAQAASAYESQAAAKVAGASVGMGTAILQLGEARRLYSQAASAFPDAGFDRYVVYVDLCSDRAGLMRNAARRWLAGEPDMGRVAYAVYRHGAARANAALAALPAAPGKATGAGFRKLAGAAVDTYKKERKRANEADKSLGGM